jgi:hypothetical protein
MEAGSAVRGSFCAVGGTIEARERDKAVLLSCAFGNKAPSSAIVLCPGLLCVGWTEDTPFVHAREQLGLEAAS